MESIEASFDDLMRENRNGGAKMVVESGFWAYVLDFLSVSPARPAEPAGIILKLR